MRLLLLPFIIFIFRCAGKRRRDHAIQRLYKLRENNPASSSRVDTAVRMIEDINENPGMTFITTVLAVLVALFIYQLLMGFR